MPVLFGLLVFALISTLGTFAVLNLNRSGAASAEEAVQKFTDALTSSDIAGIMASIEPTERDTLQALTDNSLRRANEFDMSNMIAKVSGGDPQNMEYSLEGVNFELNNVKQEISELGDRYTRVQFTEGDYRYQIKKDQTRGVLRASYELNEQMEDVDDTGDFSEFQPSIIATKIDGGWFVSLEQSVASNFVAQMGRELPIPKEPSKGGNSPAAAASNFFSELQGQDGLQAIEDVGQAMVRGEFSIMQLLVVSLKREGYPSGDQAPKTTKSEFENGPENGTTGVAWVKELSGESDNGTTTVKDQCITSTSGFEGSSDEDKRCLAPVGYWFDSTPEPAPGLIGLDNRLGIATVKEEGQWRVSILRTLVELANSYQSKLTKEQYYALSRVEPADKSSGALEEGDSEVSMNSAGYAVKTLQVDMKTTLNIKVPGTAMKKISVFKADSLLDELPASGAHSYNGNENLKQDMEFELEPGEYVVLLRDNTPWEEFDPEDLSEESLENMPTTFNSRISVKLNTQ